MSIVDESLGADCAGLGVDVEVGVGGAGNAGLSVPDGLVEGALGALSGPGVDEGSGLGAGAGSSCSVVGRSLGAGDAFGILLIPE